MRRASPAAAASLLAAVAIGGCGTGGVPRPAPGASALQRLPEDVEAISLLGDTLRPRPLGAGTAAQYEAELAVARVAYERAPKDADSIIWLGRRTAYLGRFREAIRIYDRGIDLHPRDARLYRHRGHRFLSIRRPDLALADLEEAARLARRRPDEVEPDGRPNARNIPLTTLRFNIWYHLGLTQYLRGDYDQARLAYREGLKASHNPDSRVATSHWLYMTLRRLRRDAEARALVAGFTPDMDIIEDSAYHRLVLMYTGTIPPDSLVDLASDAPIADVATGYGVGNWFWVNGDRERARRIWRRVIASGQWPSFGYIAAEYDLARGRR